MPCLHPSMSESLPAQCSFVALITVLATLTATTADAQDRPAEAIQDNSFLVEEAYNQEAGVVQHILNITGSVNRLGGRDDRTLSLVFTQEWPLLSQRHQLSYTIPYSFADGTGASSNGLEDILLNYRFQLAMETARMPAIAPRISLILPSGNKDKGFGTGEVGYQFNLAASKVVGDRWTVHGNAGATFTPGVNGRDLMGYNLGVSAIYAITRNFNAMLEGVANWVAEVDEFGGRERPFTAVVSPGLRYAFNLPENAQVVVGVAVPIGLTAETPDFGIFLYFSFEHGFASAPTTTLLPAGK